MRSPAHISFGLFSGSIVASFYSSNLGIEFGMNNLTIASWFVAIIASLLPDIDNRHAPLSRILPFLSNFISRRWPHRTLMHSLAGVGISTFAFYITLRLMAYVIQYYMGIPLAKIHISLLTSLFVFCFVSHLVLDTFTRQGIRWLFPLIHNPFGYPSLEQYRFITGDKRAEIPITAISLLLFCWYIPIAMEGAELSLSNVIGNFSQLKEVYMRAVNKEVVLEFEGSYESNKTPLTGRALVLLVEEDHFIAYTNNSIHHIGEDEGDIRLIKGKCKLLNSPPVESSTIYHNSRLTDILSGIKENVLVSGHLDANQTFEVRRPFDDRTITVSGKSLTLRFAGKSDIEALQVVLKKGDMSATEIQQQIQHKQGLIASLTSARQRTGDLYERGLLFTRITEQRKELKQLEEKQEKEAKQEGELLFSGRLSLRVVPSF